MNGQSSRRSSVDTVMEKSELFSAMITVARRATAWTIVYAIGYLKWNAAWVLLPLSVSGLVHFFQSRRRPQRDASGFEVRALPTWVHFPDTERAEWVNGIIRDLWPNLQNMVTDRLQAVKEEIPWLRAVRLAKTSIGRIPLRVGGIKVFDANEAIRDEVIMDVEITLATDCDVALQCFPWIHVSMRDVYVHGTMRLRLRPLIDDLPLIGGVDAAFVHKPALDFDLGGLANLVDVPGVSAVVRNYALEQIAALLVVPNSLRVPLAVHGHKEVIHTYRDIKLVTLRVLEARNLLARDVNLVTKNTSDPYVKIKFGGEERVSNVERSTLNPRWDLMHEFITEDDPCQGVEVEVWDWDKAGKDDFLGSTVIDVATRSNCRGDVWLRLEGVDSGEIHCYVDCRRLTSVKPALVLQKAVGESNNANAVLSVFLESCRNLDRTKKGRAPCPKVIMSISGRETKTSQTMSYTQNPTFDEEFNFLVANPECDDLQIRVVDAKSERAIGQLRLCLSDLVATATSEYPCQPWLLERCLEGGSILMGVTMTYPEAKD